MNHEYYGLCGNDKFRDLAKTLILGGGSASVSEDRVLSIQTYGGGGALTVASEYLFKKLNYDVIYISEQTWENHGRLLKVSFRMLIKRCNF